MGALVACAVLAGPASARTDDRTKDVWFVHGYKNNASSDCATEWAAMKERFRIWGFTGAWGTVGYYTGDKNCTSLNSHGSHSVHYSSDHSNGAHGTYTDIRHLGYHLAWLMYNSSASKGKTTDVVAHSMGGLILRYAMAQVERRHSSFPPYLRIEDVVTLGTPHGGARFTTFICFTTQCDQMRAGSGFLNWLQSYAWEPDTAVDTDWSTYGSDRDDWVAADRAAGTDSDRSPAHKYIGSCHKTWYTDASGVEHDEFKTLTSSDLTAVVWRYNCNGTGWTRDATSHWPVRRAARALTWGTE